jgi:hypothetical protein
MEKPTTPNTPKKSSPPTPSQQEGGENVENLQTFLDRNALGDTPETKVKLRPLYNIKLSP